MLALIFNFLLSRLKRSCRDIRSRMLRLHIRRIAEDLKLQQEFEQVALTSIADSLKNGISEKAHAKLTRSLTDFANLYCSPVSLFTCSNPPPELLLVYNQLAKTAPTPNPTPAPRKKSAPLVRESVLAPTSPGFDPVSESPLTSQILDFKFDVHPESLPLAHCDSGEQCHVLGALPNNQITRSPNHQISMGLNKSVEFSPTKMSEQKSTKFLTKTKQSTCKNSQAEFQMNIQPECPPECEPVFTHPAACLFATSPHKLTELQRRDAHTANTDRTTTNMKHCHLALEDGSIFTGQSFGAEGTSTGEVVFNTALTGYQEILTDPSYCGQIVTMTAPLMGNYGVNVEDVESNKTYLSGFVVKEPARRVSNYRSSGDLAGYLKTAGVVGISNIDTRALTRRLRVSGAMRGVLSTEHSDPGILVGLARKSDAMTGRDLVAEVAPKRDRVWNEGRELTRRIVAIDCGIKHNILRLLAEFGAAVTVMPPNTPAEAILERQPHGILIGNGPGDPAVVTDAIEMLQKLIGRVPIFGICLGHQLLALALGAETYKLKFGHHGANHPVLHLETGRVEITSQNHGFAVDEKSLEKVGGRATHINLYDRSLEGFAHEDKRLFAVQYHPESAPGPHDSRYLFERFAKSI